MPQCFDVNDTPQDCGAASDAGGSSCFNDQAQEVSCSEVGGYANPNASVPGNPIAAGIATSSGVTALTSATIASQAITAAGQAYNNTVAQPQTKITTPIGTLSSASISSALPLLVAAVLVAFIYTQTKK